MLRCADDTLYTGITTDVKRRLEEHNGTKAGARYTRARQPVVMIYQESHPTRSAASVREHEIKSLDRAQKLALISV